VSKNDRNLTAKQMAFCREFILDCNGTQAAIRAGYSPKTANEQAARLLANVSVAAEVERLMKERSARTKIDADRVIQELARIGLVDVRKLFNLDGTLMRLDKLDDDTAAAIAGIEVNELRDAEGFVLGHAKKIKLVDKLGALTKLAQHLGLLDTKITLKGDAQNPLQVLVREIQGRSMPVRQSAWGGDERDDEVVTINHEGKKQ